MKSRIVGTLFNDTINAVVGRDFSTELILNLNSVFNGIRFVYSASIAGQRDQELVKDETFVFIDVLFKLYSEAADESENDDDFRLKGVYI